MDPPSTSIHNLDPPGSIIAKLEQIGISGPVLTLFKSYLNSRKQCVVVDGVKSTFIDIEAGVPQGSRSSKDWSSQDRSSQDWSS